METSTHPLVVIAGPTASGKSSLGLQLAQRLNGAILCADSRQIYRELNIGTAKPSLSEQNSVPHLLFDLAEPSETYTVAQYLSAAKVALETCWRQKKLPIFVGGTGLYLKSLLYAYDIPAVPPQADLRAAMEAREAETPGCLHQELQAVDPQAAEKIHPHDLHRLTRALEVYAMTGLPISQHQKRSATLRYPQVKYLGLRVEKNFLYTRIQARIQTMLDTGLIEEVQNLQQKYGPDLPLLQTLNYQEIMAYLSGAWDLTTAQAQMFIHTRQYAKRQMTWFKKDPAVQWFEIQDETDFKAPEAWIMQGIIR